MFSVFFQRLRGAGIPVSVTEYLSLLAALDGNAMDADIESFYFLARTVLVKDERFFDRFDRVFGDHFSGVERVFERLLATVPADWLKARTLLDLDEEQRRQIEALGGWEEIMRALRERLEQQQEAHTGGNRMIGTGGTSPIGAYGYNPDGIRIGQDQSRHGRAVKVWERRDFHNLDGGRELGTRNIKLALRSLRRLARHGAAQEFDLERTIDCTARNAGWLDVQMVPERHNATKLLLFLDIGGSMDRHVRRCEELFSAARSEFRQLEFFYFHNCVYEEVWTDNRRRHLARLATMDIIHRFGRDHKLVFVGDASMSPYEIMVAGGSIEHWNEEPGQVWLKRLLATYPCAAWLNPGAESYWGNSASVGIVRELVSGRMFPLTIDGITAAMSGLKRPVIQ